MQRRFKSGVATRKTSEPKGVPIPMSAERPQTSSVASSLPTPTLAAALTRRRFTLSGAADSQNHGLMVYCRMPFSHSFLSEDQFQCSICLDIFINPASTPCGHSFCMACIGRYWDGAKLCQCPLCKETFKKRPDLQINRTLREITEQFKSMSGVSRLDSGRWRGVLGAGDGGGGGGEDTDHQDPSTIEREWMDNKLRVSEAEIHELILQRQRKMEEIRSSLAQLQLSVERETAGIMGTFSALVCAVERSQAELMEMVEISRRVAEHQADAAICQLEQEVTELRKRSHAFSQMAQSDDNVHFIKSYPALCTPPPIRDWSGVSVNPDLGTGPIYRSLSVLVQHFQEELNRMAEFGVHLPLESSPVPQPKVKRVQEYAVDVTMDSSTAHPRLILSENGKNVKCGDHHQSVPHNPERFDRVVCVLGREGFSSGQHYWEVEVGGKTDWDLGVASSSINRKGKIMVSPSNGYWFLSLRDKHNYAFRTEPSTELLLNLRPQKIGVYVDYEKGQVSFYNVDAKLHIYTFLDTFCESVFPFFSPCTNKSGKNDGTLTITPVLLMD
ncbi:E3 ubiquitin-protein ligase TRIM39 isoform X1 [Coregonus clupeaformis]|uniref:E3 ubiquitin-protein ligase TRIM39 isoform X1 n=2 Tax=Coregonus clupeaformis TaxID=59861 RepID=UPI001BDFA998|nr:E3 ubiquitin-protein ligase TRIM39 isoform X1 [Coregonus clupeaformis]